MLRSLTVPSEACIVVWALTAANATSGRGPVNLVKNGGFDAVEPSGKIAAWAVECTPEMKSVRRATEQHVGGAACFDLGVLSKPRVGQQSSISQDIPVQEGKRYALTFAYQTGYKGPYAGYEALFVSLNGQTVWMCDLSASATDPAIGESEFRRATVLFDAPADRVRLSIGKRGLRSAGHGWAFHSLVDDVVVRLARPREKGVVVSAQKPHKVPGPPVRRSSHEDRVILGDKELFDRTMAHISDDDLIGALDLGRPELRAVKEAAGKSAKLALEALCAHLEHRTRPVDVVDASMYRDELRAYHKAFPKKSDGLARLFNAMYEWTLADADRTVRGEHMYAGSKTNWVKFGHGKVDWVTNRGNIYGFHYFGSLEPLMWAWLYTGEETYAEAFADAFNDWWEQRDRVRPQWCVWYKLGLAIRGRRLARALHHLAGTRSFDVATQTRILKTILGSCRWLMRDWETRPAWSSNWGLFVATGLIRMGALAPELREAESWVDRGREIMRRYARTFKADGGTEALGYHAGILLSLTRPQRLLDANGRTGYLDDLKLRQGISRAMRLLARMTMPTGQFPAIGDARYGWPTEALAIGAELLKDEELKSVLVAVGEREIAKKGAFHVPGLPPFTDVAELKRGSLPGIPLKAWRPKSYVFPDQGLTALRRGDSLSDMVYMAVSHGVYGHSHPDFLGITLYAYDDLLLADPGVPNYYGPHTGEMRRSRAHNCLIVDGANMARAKPKMVAFDTSPAADLWRCCNVGYESLGVVNTRTIVNVKDKPGFFVVVDQVKRTTNEYRRLDVYYHALQADVRVESPRRVIVGKGPVLTIASPQDNGTLWQGKEWSILLETNMVTKQFPFVAYRRESDGEEHFCSVLAADPEEPRDIEVQVRDGEFRSLEVHISEGPTKHLVLVAGTVGKLPDAPSRGRWRLIAGRDQPVRLFVPR